jgi:hypothetical protein
LKRQQLGPSMYELIMLDTCQDNHPCLYIEERWMERFLTLTIRLSLFPLGNTVTTLLQAVLQAEAHLSVIMIMNPFKFVVAAAAATVLLVGTQSVAAKPFAGSLGGLNTNSLGLPC